MGRCASSSLPVKDQSTIICQGGPNRLTTGDELPLSPEIEANQDYPNRARRLPIRGGGRDSVALRRLTIREGGPCYIVKQTRRNAEEARTRYLTESGKPASLIVRRDPYPACFCMLDSYRVRWLVPWEVPAIVFQIRLGLQITRNSPDSSGVRAWLNTPPSNASITIAEPVVTNFHLSPGLTVRRLTLHRDLARSQCAIDSIQHQHGGPGRSSFSH